MYIIGGCVVGVLVIVAIIVGYFCFYKPYKEKKLKLKFNSV